MKYYSFHNINILNVILVKSWLFPAAKNKTKQNFFVIFMRELVEDTDLNAHLKEGALIRGLNMHI